MTISEMRERILIQKSTDGKDENGNHVLMWNDYFSCAAYANNLSGEEYWEAARVNSQTDMYFMVRYCSELSEMDTENYRIVFRGEIYNITFIDNIQYRNRQLKIRVTKAVEAWQE